MSVSAYALAHQVFDLFSVMAVHTTSQHPRKCIGKECASVVASSHCLQFGCRATPAATHIRYRLMR